MAFTAEEIAVIRKFFAWLESEGGLDEWSGATGANDEGVIVSTYSAEEDYGQYAYTGKETSVIPWPGSVTPA